MLLLFRVILKVSAYKALRVRHMHLLLGSDTCTFTAMVMNTIVDTSMNISNHSSEHERGFIHEHPTNMSLKRITFMNIFTN